MHTFVLSIVLLSFALFGCVLSITRIYNPLVSNVSTISSGQTLTETITPTTSTSDASTPSENELGPLITRRLRSGHSFHVMMQSIRKRRSFGIFNIDDVDVRQNAMPSDRKQHALNSVTFALLRYTSENSIVEYLRNKMHELYGGSWHCIVSDHWFGAGIWYDNTDYIYMKAGKYYIMLYER